LPEGIFPFLVDKRLKEIAKKLKADEEKDEDEEPKKKGDNTNKLTKEKKTITEQ
jgi:hypothetical protein